MDGERLASGSSDGSIRIWSLEKIAIALCGSEKTEKNGKNQISNSALLSHELGHHAKNVNQLQWCPFSSNILASCSNDKSFKIWETTKNPSNILTIQLESEILTLAWHPLQPIFTVGTKDDKIFFFQFEDSQFSSAKLIETLKFSSEVNDLSWSVDGSNLAVALGIGNVEIYRKFEKIQSLKVHTADCFCARFKGSDLLSVGSSDSQISLWSRDDHSGYSCFRVLNRMEWPIRTLSFSHDAQFLAVGSEDPFIAIEHIQSGSLIAKINTTNSKNTKNGIPINAVTWHPNKHILAFAGSEVDDRTGKATGSIKLFGLC